MESEILHRDAYTAITDPKNDVSVSLASIWEAAIKAGVGKLTPPERFVDAIALSGFTLLQISTSHAMAVTRLPRHHRDPFDRLIIAQTMIEGLTLVTRDTILPRYGVPILAA